MTLLPINRPISAVVDTGVFISAALMKGSPPDRVVDYILDNGAFIFSSQTVDELKHVIRRQKFDRKTSFVKREFLLTKVQAVSSVIDITENVDVCRDPTDNMFLSVAVSGPADVIVSGDKDLLVLHPFRNIPILTPRQFLDEVIYLGRE